MFAVSVIPIAMCTAFFAAFVALILGKSPIGFVVVMVDTVALCPSVIPNKSRVVVELIL